MDSGGGGSNSSSSGGGGGGRMGANVSEVGEQTTRVETKKLAAKEGRRKGREGEEGGSRPSEELAVLVVSDVQVKSGTSFEASDGWI